MKKLMVGLVLVLAVSAEAKTYVGMSFDQRTGAYGVGWGNSLNELYRDVRNSLGYLPSDPGYCPNGCISLAVTYRTPYTTVQGYAIDCGANQGTADAKALRRIRKYGGGYVLAGACSWDQ